MRIWKRIRSLIVHSISFEVAYPISTKHYHLINLITGLDFSSLVILDSAETQNQLPIINVNDGNLPNNEPCILKTRRLALRSTRSTPVWLSKNYLPQIKDYIDKLYIYIFFLNFIQDHKVYFFKKNGEYSYTVSPTWD